MQRLVLLPASARASFEDSTASVLHPQCPHKAADSAGRCNTFANQPGRVFLRGEILSQVWGNDVIVGDRTIDVHVRKIRAKLGIECITTVKGVGYKFDY